jgi:GNAT superfamily N-acetyltransferase
MTFILRTAAPSDFPLLVGIERTADRLFAEVGIVFPPGPTVVEEAIEAGADVYVAGEPPVAFAAVRERDGYTHLEQIAVRTDQSRQGIGGRLLGRVVEHAAERGSAGVTLLTFRDVPWNGPWYARHGFTELPQERWPEQVRELWDHEIDAGLHKLGPRLVMYRPASPSL